MRRLSRERLVRSGLVFVLLTGFPVAAFGGGHRASEAVLSVPWCISSTASPTASRVGRTATTATRIRHHRLTAGIWTGRFTCFPTRFRAPSLLAMFSQPRRAWAFAPADSDEYKFHVDNGSYATQFTVCWI